MKYFQHDSAFQKEKTSPFQIFIFSYSRPREALYSVQVLFLIYLLSNVCILKKIRKNLTSYFQAFLHWKNDMFCEFLEGIISIVFFCISIIFLNQLFRSLNTAEL